MRQPAVKAAVSQIQRDQEGTFVQQAPEGPHSSFHADPSRSPCDQSHCSSCAHYTFIRCSPPLHPFQTSLQPKLLLQLTSYSTNQPDAVHTSLRSSSHEPNFNSFLLSPFCLTPSRLKFSCSALTGFPSTINKASTHTFSASRPAL